MKPRNPSSPSPPEDQANLAERATRLGEHLHTACAVAHVVRRVVLGDELRLRDLWMRGEQAGPHLVHEMLDRAAVELVERTLDLVAHRARAEKTDPLRDPVAQIGVAPVRVEMDGQRPIDELGEGRVIITGERGERAPGGLYEDHAFPAALSGGDPRLAGVDVERDPRDPAVAPRRAEKGLAPPPLAGSG